jgi:hypothetical protein
MPPSRMRASRAARGRALRAYARHSDVPDDLAGQILAIVSNSPNPVLRLKLIDALLPLTEPLRAERRATVLALRSEDWTWSEIGAELGTGRQRAWQIANGL